MALNEVERKLCQQMGISHAEYERRKLAATKRDKSGGDAMDPVRERDGDMPHMHFTDHRGTRPGEAYDEESGQLAKHARLLDVKAMRVDDFTAGLRAGAAIMRASIEHPKGMNASEQTRCAIATFSANVAHEQGDRPHYDHHGEPEIFAGDSEYSAENMDSMPPEDHIGHIGELADAMANCEEEGCENSDCKNCRGRFAKMMAHAHRYAEKTGSDGDGEEDNDSPLAATGEKVLKTFENSVKISSQGSGHLAPMPRRE